MRGGEKSGEIFVEVVEKMYICNWNGVVAADLWAGHGTKWRGFVLLCVDA